MAPNASQRIIQYTCKIKTSIVKKCILNTQYNTPYFLYLHSQDFFIAQNVSRET